MDQEETPAYTRTIDDQEPIVTAVTEAIADLENTRARHVDPLYDSIDMEAVEALLYSSDPQVMVSFVHKSYLIKIVAGNRIEVFN